jgi:hypothetical protein
MGVENDNDAVSIYGILVDRNKHEGSLFWTRYAVFFSIVSGLAIAWAKGVEVQASSIFGNPFFLGVIICGGSVVAFAWVLVSWDGAYWQEYFNSKIINFERANNVLPQVYSEIHLPRFLPDVVAVAIVVSGLSWIVWTVVAFLYDWRYGVFALGSCILTFIFSRLVQDLLKPRTHSQQDSSSKQVGEDDQRHE